MKGYPPHPRDTFHRLMLSLHEVVKHSDGSESPRFDPPSLDDEPLTQLLREEAEQEGIDLEQYMQAHNS